MGSVTVKSDPLESCRCSFNVWRYRRSFDVGYYRGSFDVGRYDDA